jgi:3-isopropylmalate/(R)-2-methylmalate dehydratase small subunit
LLDFGIAVSSRPVCRYLFYNNCFKNGILPPLVLPAKPWPSLMDDARKGANAGRDLENRPLPLWSDLQFRDRPVPQHLMNRLDDIDLTLEGAASISS